MNRRHEDLLTAAIALVIGVIHVAVALWLDFQVLQYPRSPFDSPSLGSFLWNVSGLLLLGVLPIAFSIRYRLVAPALLFVLGAIVPIYTTLMTPPPEFTMYGDTVIILGGQLHFENYLTTWYARLLMYLFAGLAEYAARRYLQVLPSPSRSVKGLTLPTNRRTAALAALCSGWLHMAVTVGFVVSSDRLIAQPPAFMLWFIGGMTILAAVPAFLLFHERLLAPFLVFLVLFAIFLEPSADESGLFYFVIWILPLVVILLSGGIEYGFRWAGGKVMRSL